MPYLRYEYTRSGLAPVVVGDRELSDADALAAVTRYYAPKPAWMTHIPGPFLRFRNRHDFNAHLARTRS